MIPRWRTHQVAIAYLDSGATTTLGKPVYLTSDTTVDNINPHIAPCSARDFLVSWESIANASCDAETCLGSFTGTHIRVVDASGRFVTPDLVVQAHIAGDIAVLPDGSLIWPDPPRPRPTPRRSGPPARPPGN
ncbi:MAG TPA: hypothetical protein VFN97_03085 [Actinospica sp.]|nr:hypothetical protein [Actinospica sp.]